MKKLGLIITATAALALASPAYAQHWHGGGHWRGGYGGGWHHGGGGWGPGAAIAGGLLGLGIAGAAAGSYHAYPQPYYAYPQPYYAYPQQCWWQYDQWGQLYQVCR